jgi:heat shock protein HtpX
MLRRWGFFFLTNILVIVTISLVLNLLGVQPYLTRSGIDYPSLMVFCLAWGMGGSFISLLLSRFMAKQMTGMTVIDPRSPGHYQWLVESVHNLSRSAKLPAMPEVGIYPSMEVNAFATGPSKRKSLVAVSEGLLRSMSRDEIEGVLAHEVAHIQNGDMVTMTLIQGVVNAFSMFLSRVIAFALSTAMQGNKDSEEQGGFSPLLNSVLVVVFDILFSILGHIVVSYFSRAREFRADRGSARLSGTTSKMIAALRALGRTHEIDESSMAQASALTALKIDAGGRGWMSLFRTHPPLDQRIAALERGA